MKQKIAFSLTLLLSITSLLGCNSNNKKEEERTFVCDMNDYSYSIVINESASETTKYSASEIQKYFLSCANMEIDVINDDNLSIGNESAYISLGNTKLYEKYASNKDIDLSKETLNEDGFYIFTKGNNILLNSYNDRGIMYAAYELIESILGVEFLNYEYTYLPNLSEVPLYEYDKAYVPAFAQRAYLNTAIFYNNFDYCAHMRFNTDYCIMPSNMGGSSKWHSFGVPAHTVTEIVPYTPYTTGEKDEDNNPIIDDEHKQIYAHYDDRGIISNYWYDGSIDLCYTNGINYNIDGEESSLNLIVKNLKAILEEDRECEYLHIGQMDVPASCPCSHCQEQANKYKASGVMIHFMNKVEEEINSWLKETQNGRQVIFSMFAYSYNINPPVNDNGQPIDNTVIPNENVYVKYAPIHANYLHSLDDERQNNQTKGQLKQWANLGCKFMAWTYHLQFHDYFLYYPSFNCMSSLLKELKAADVIYEFAQSSYNEYNSFHDDLEAYIFSKLCWNLNLDVNQLVENYCLKFFGEIGGQYVLNFINDMTYRYAYLEGAMNVDLSLVDQILNTTSLPYNFMEKENSYFLDAIEEINNADNLTNKEKETYINHLEVASLIPLYMELMIYRYYDGVDDSSYYNFGQRFFDLCTKHNVVRYGESATLTIAGLKNELGF